MNIKKINKIINSKIFANISSFSLILVYLFFIYNHTIAILNNNINKFTILFLLMETVVVFMLLIRKDPVKTTSSAMAWFFSFLGTFVALLYSPDSVETLNSQLGIILLLTGSILSIFSYLSLNTSFAIVPAIREIKTNGLYKIIRHPMYFSYFVSHSGYILLNFSYYNLAIVIILFISLLARIYYEEKILSTDKNYLEYKKKVKNKIIPFIY